MKALTIAHREAGKVICFQFLIESLGHPGCKCQLQEVQDSAAKTQDSMVAKEFSFHIEELQKIEGLQAVYQSEGLGQLLLTFSYAK
jgi:hypothetical protein